MLSKLQAGKRLVGLKQSRRAIEGGQAEVAFAASDADAPLVAGFERLCREKGIPLCAEYTKTQLGIACGIEVGAAFAVLLKKS